MLASRQSEDIFSMSLQDSLGNGRPPKTSEAAEARIWQPAWERETRQRHGTPARQPKRGSSNQPRDRRPRETSEAAEARIRQPAWERETRQAHGRPARQPKRGSGNQPGQRETTGDQRGSESADLEPAWERETRPGCHLASKKIKM